MLIGVPVQHHRLSAFSFAHALECRGAGSLTFRIVVAEQSIVSRKKFTGTSLTTHQGRPYCVRLVQNNSPPVYSQERTKLLCESSSVPCCLSCFAEVASKSCICRDNLKTKSFECPPENTQKQTFGRKSSAEQKLSTHDIKFSKLLGVAYPASNFKQLHQCLLIRTSCWCYFITSAAGTSLNHGTYIC